MTYYLNELSVQYPCSETREQGRELMAQFVGVCQKVKKIGFDKIRYTFSLKGICLSSDYFVQTWLKDQDVEREIRDKFRAITNETPYFDEDDSSVLEQQEKWIYSYNSQETQGLSLAHFKDTLAVSFMTDIQWDATDIKIQRLFDDKTDIVNVRHAATNKHIEAIKRIFEFNPKHGKCGKSAQSNQSKMYCCDEKEAEILLNTALQHPKKERWFCNYDNKNKRFIVFLPHSEEQGKYHGFHYENTPNADPNRDLNNPQNGIPLSLQDKLKQRMKDE